MTRQRPAFAGWSPRLRISWLLLAWTVILSGCMFSRPTGRSAPVVFPTPPDVQQIVNAINANASRVQQLHAEDVRLSVPGQFGSVKAQLDFDRPTRFRLSAESIRGPELDLGSNESKFWIWVRQHQPPTVFFGYQDQFHVGMGQQVLPLPPHQIFADGLGLLYLDPQADYQIYASNTPGLLQVRSHVKHPQGDLLRILEVDRQRALVTKQLLYAANNDLLMSVEASDFLYAELEDVALPRSLRVSLPPAGLAFQLNAANYAVNVPSIDLERFEMPEIPNHRYRDLANPADMQGIQLLGNAPPPDFYDSQATVSQPRTAWQRLLPRSVFRR